MNKLTASKEIVIASDSAAIPTSDRATNRRTVIASNSTTIPCRERTVNRNPVIASDCVAIPSNNRAANKRLPRSARNDSFNSIGIATRRTIQ